MRLSDQAAAALFLENSGVPMQVLALSVLDSPTDLGAIQQHVWQRLRNASKYRQRLAYVPYNLGRPVWVDHDEFDITEHVIAVEAQGSSTDDAIAQAVQLASAPLDRAKPLWRMYLIQTSDQSTVLAHVAHLAMLENVSLSEDAHVFFDLQRTPRELDEDTWEPSPAPSGAQLATEALQENTKQFAAQAQRLGNFSSSNGEMIRRATESVTRFLTEPVCMAPWNQGFVSATRSFTHTSVPYLQIRAARRALGGSDNDIVLSVLIEAAARYLKAHGVESKDQHLRLFCPVKVRREDANGVRGNRISGAFPVADCEPKTITDRLQEVRWENESIKQNREAQALQLLSELAPPLPTIPGLDQEATSRLFGQTPLNWLTFNPINFFQQFMPRSMPNISPLFTPSMAGFNFSCVTSQGAQTSLFFAGHEVKQQFMMPVLAANLGFGVAVTTYAQTLTFNLVADPALMPDLELMQSHLEAALHELFEAAESTKTESPETVKA